MTKTEIINDKISRARSIAAELIGIPFVRLLALGNSVAMGTATELSDLDFFVVTAPNRLWTARFFLLMQAKWLGFAKRAGTTADQADFGFWVDETALDLSPIALKKSPLAPLSNRGELPPLKRGIEGDFVIDDPYLSRWLATLIPLLDQGGVFKRLMSENRELVGVILSQAKNLIPERSFDKLRMTNAIELVLGSWFGEPFEMLLFWIQRWKVWHEPITNRADPLIVNGQRVDVVTTRHMLKLHHFDQRAKIRDEQTKRRRKGAREESR